MSLAIVNSISKAWEVILHHPAIQALEDFYLVQRSSKASQLLLSLQYQEMLAQHRPLPKLQDTEFRVFSQHGEDGILLYLFSLLGTTNKRCVEICGGGGFDNTANLIINHGWNGLFFEGRERNIRRGQKFYARCAETKTWLPKLVHTWITAENINSLLQENGFLGDIDLLSLDMDGVDYWVWKAIGCINPRVVVLEFNNILGPDVAVTVPYKKDLGIQTHHETAFKLLRYRGRQILNTFVEKSIADRLDTYYGASLSAFVKLGRKKGYRLVGCERYGFNAFFVRSGIGEEILPEVSACECFHHPFIKYATEVRSQRILDKQWIEV